MKNTSGKHIYISKFIKLSLSVFMLFTCIHFTSVKADEIETLTINYVVVGDVDGGNLKKDRTETVNLKEGGTPQGNIAEVSSYYEFLGWYSSEDCSETSLKTTELTFVPTAPEGGWTTDTVTYYAKFHYKDDCLKTVTANYYWIGDKDNPNKQPIAKSDVVATNKKSGEQVKKTSPGIDSYTPVKESETITVWGNVENNTIDLYYYKNVVLESNSATFEYDKKEHSVSGYKVKVSGEETELTFDGISASATATEKGTYDVNFSKEDGSAVLGTIDTTGKYYVATATPGKLTITDDIVLETTDFTINYNGSVVKGTPPEVFPEDGTTVTYSTDGKSVDDPTKTWSKDRPGIKDVGTLKVDVRAYNRHTVSDVKYGSYTITVNPLDLNDFLIDVSDIYTEFTYDGQEHLLEPTVIHHGLTDPKLVKDRDYTISYNSNGIDAGEVVVTVKGIGNYTGEVTRTYKINPKPISLVSGSDEKVYDGKPLTNAEAGYADGSEHFVDGEVKEIKATGTITDVLTNDEKEVIGTPNTIEVVGNASYKASNYAIKYDLGTLTVTPITTPITVDIQANKDTYEYDGKAHSISGFTAKATGENSELFDGSKDVKLVGDLSDRSYTDANTTDTPVYEVPVVAADFAFSDNFTTVSIGKLSAGSVTITPKTYYVSTNSAEKVYDGKPLTASGSVVGLVEGDTATFTITGSQTEIGSSKNTYTDFAFTGDTKATNYVHGKDSIGTLTVVKPAPTPTPTATSDSKSSSKKSSGWDDGSPFTTDKCGNVFDRWGNKIYEAKGCNVGGYNLVRTSVED